MPTAKEFKELEERAIAAEKDLAEVRAQIKDGVTDEVAKAEIERLTNLADGLDTQLITAKEELESQTERANSAEKKLSDLKEGKVTVEEAVKRPPCFGKYAAQFKKAPAGCRGCKFHKLCKAEK
jgi:predicted  nucleic acid-binding Zn-ribbon protein